MMKPTLNQRSTLNPTKTLSSWSLLPIARHVRCSAHGTCPPDRIRYLGFATLVLQFGTICGFGIYHPAVFATTFRFLACIFSPCGHPVFLTQHELLLFFLDGCFCHAPALLVFVARVVSLSCSSASPRRRRLPFIGLFYGCRYLSARVQLAFFTVLGGRGCVILKSGQKVRSTCIY